MKVYIAGPLFNESERVLNKKLRRLISACGFETYLPQEDGGIAFDEIRQGGNAEKIRKRVFDNDLKEINNCDIIVCVLDGRVPDEGMCVELGIAYALGRRCIGYKTDARTMDEFGENVIVAGCLESVCQNSTELKELLASIATQTSS